jgi:hypothetical protein
MARHKSGDAPRLRSPAQREKQARAMSDAELIEHLAQDGHPDIEDDLWRPILEAEARRRGLQT